MAGDKSDSTRDSNHGVFLGNRHLRSKSGLEGATKWRLKHPATLYLGRHEVNIDNHRNFGWIPLTISILNPEKRLYFSDMCAEEPSPTLWVAFSLRICHASVILSNSEESGGHISYTLSYLRSFTPPAASYKMTGRMYRMTKEKLRS